MIVPIGQWVLKEATRQLARWQQTVAGARHLTVAINVSGRQIQTSSLVGDVSDAIGLADIDPGTVTLEITETVLLSDSDTARDRLQALKELGVRIAIDDFGTGYSSLSYLSTFPLDIMKLDKSFLAELTDLPHRQAFLSSIIDMGHTLQLATLGEGIETVTQLAALRECGCDLGQGFLFARPLTAAQATMSSRAPTTATSPCPPSRKERGSERLREVCEANERRRTTQPMARTRA